jgi:hypothetical protein
MPPTRQQQSIQMFEPHFKRTVRFDKLDEEHCYTPHTSLPTRNLVPKSSYVSANEYEKNIS